MFGDSRSKAELYGPVHPESSFPVLKTAMYGCYLFTGLFLSAGVYSFVGSETDYRAGLLFLGAAFGSLVAAETTRILLVIFKNTLNSRK